ncbi:MAG TPA: BlaI/MecI/CopY family transcriptional regulator [Gemmatimonadaceae bacterium]|nr:BlaI/MecI/CopY family transcriptional regulator [Gemmatimonadaceae bacterium]
MSERRLRQLSRRERQIMDVIFRRGSATASDVHAGLPDAPSYSAVRAMLRILEEKGHLTHTSDGPRYVYAPVMSRSAARQSALRQVVRTFFDGSASKAVATLLDMSGGNLSEQELQELEALIARARREDR